MYVHCHAFILYDKYKDDYIREMCNMLKLVSGKKRLHFYRSPVDFASFSLEILPLYDSQNAVFHQDV